MHVDFGAPIPDVSRGWVVFHLVRNFAPQAACIALWNKCQEEEDYGSRSHFRSLCPRPLSGALRSLTNSRVNNISGTELPLPLYLQESCD